MGANPYESDAKFEASPMAASALQHEADQARFGHHSSGGVINSFEDSVAKIPEPVAATAGLISGVLARFPGDFGVAGKVFSVGLGLTYGSDLAFRLSGRSSGQDTGSMVLQDALVLGSLGAGILAGPRLSPSIAKDSSVGEALAKAPLGDQLAADWTEVPSWAEGTRYPAVRQEFLDGIKPYSPAEQAKMKDALSVAEDAHLGQLRQVHIDNPGVQDPFIIHPVRSALILMKEAGVSDSDAITGALLHDVVEDSGGRYTAEGITSRFGPNVGSIIRYVTKPPVIDGIKPDLAPYYSGLESAPQMAREVKLADRLDNIRDTTMLTDPSFQQRKLQETIDHYIPLAEQTSPFFADQLKVSTQQVAELLKQGN